MLLPPLSTLTAHSSGNHCGGSANSRRVTVRPAFLKPASTQSAAIASPLVPAMRPQ